MATISFEGRAYQTEPGETVLEALLRQESELPYSCRSGACQTCLMRATLGEPGPKAQAGLKATLKTQGYFLPCVCIPGGDMEIVRPDTGVMVQTVATVQGKDRLNQDIVRLRLQCREPFEYRPGQFLHVHRSDGLMRSYSIASVPCLDAEHALELHVRKLPGGRMSAWIHDELAIGESVDLRGPAGECYYVPGNPDQPLLLVGTGSGLAPLWGIVKDALRQGHRGPIRLYHGSWRVEGLYLVEEARQLAYVNPNLTYTPCVDGFDGESLTGYRIERVDKAVQSDLPQLKGWRIFLCGHPDLVAGMRKRAFLAGASLQEIFADPFVRGSP